MRSLLFFLFSLTASAIYAETSKDQLVQQLNEKGFDIYYASNSGDNALHMAAKKLDFEAVALLLEYGFNPSRANKTGNTALHFAAEKGDLAIMQLLIDAGANVNAANELEQTPYHKALNKQKYEAMSLLQDNGYVINANTFEDKMIAIGMSPNKVDNSGNSLLHRLAKTGNLELMRAALEHGMDPRVVNKKGNTPLTLAINNRDLEMVQLLLDFGNHHPSLPYLWAPNMFDAVYQAAKMSWKEGVIALIQTTPEIVSGYVNQMTDNGISILHQACAKGDLAIVELLVENGANINQLTHSEYIYGDRDPHYWDHNDWNDWGDVGVGGLDRYKEESGYEHPVASPLAIAKLMQPGNTDMHEYLIQRGAIYTFNRALNGEGLWEYLE